MISPDGKTLFVGRLFINDRFVTQMWDLESGRKIRNLRVSSSGGLMAISPNGKILITLGRKIYFWDLDQRKKRYDISDENWNFDFKISPNSQWVVGIYSIWKRHKCKSWFKVLDLQNGEEVRTIVDISSIESFRDFVISPDCNLIALAQREEVDIWNFNTGDLIQKIKKFSNLKFSKHLDAIWQVSFSPDSKNVLTTGDDEQIQIWDIETGKNVYTLAGNHPIHYFMLSRDSQVLVAIGGENTSRGYEAKFQVFGT